VEKSRVERSNKRIDFTGRTRAQKINQSALLKIALMKLRKNHKN
jgi:hypothetical protein